jgi:hypothetical protein
MGWIGLDCFFLHGRMGAWQGLMDAWARCVRCMGAWRPCWALWDALAEYGSMGLDARRCMGAWRDEMLDHEGRCAWAMRTWFVRPARDLHTKSHEGHV